MDSDMEEWLRAAFQDKLRLLWAFSPSHTELHTIRSSTEPAQPATTLLPSTRVLLKRREMAEVEQELQSRREEFRQRMEGMVQRREQLAQKEEQHQDLVLKFDALLKASVARRERALRGEGEQEARALAQEAEAARLHRELDGLLRHRERLARHLRSLRRFGDYLRHVLARMGQFQDVLAMLVHFGVLTGARAALAQEAEAGQEQLAQGRTQLQWYQEETSTELLGTNNELAQLHTRLEAARQDVLQWECSWAQVQSMATQKTLLLGQIRLAILNLFQLSTTQLRIPMDVALEDSQAQLDMVLLCMRRLAEICATNTHPPRHRGARSQE